MDETDPLKRPETDEGFSDQGIVGDETPVTAVKAVEPIVTHDEVMPFGDADPKFAPMPLNQVAVGIAPRCFVKVIVRKSSPTER